MLYFGPVLRRPSGYNLRKVLVQVEARVAQTELLRLMEEAYSVAEIEHARAAPPPPIFTMIPPSLCHTKVPLPFPYKQPLIPSLYSTCIYSFPPSV